MLMLVYALRTPYFVLTGGDRWIYSRPTVETAGDCYIAAGGLTLIDEDGFTCIDPTPDPQEAAQRVLSFAKVGGREQACASWFEHQCSAAWFRILCVHGSCWRTMMSVQLKAIIEWLCLFVPSGVSGRNTMCQL
eukprot:1143893-Pelagomonas_calceolata.AAC.15